MARLRLEPPQRLRGIREVRVLRLSMVMTGVVSLLGIGFGIATPSLAILFNGLSSAIDAAVTALMLFVARLLVRQRSDQYQFGYWQFEPLVMALKSSSLLMLLAYGFLDSVKHLTREGHMPDLRIATFYAGITAILSVGSWALLRRANRSVQSDMIRVDCQSWLLTASITVALLMAFLLAQAIGGTRFGWAARYIDPAMLALIALCMFPVPLVELRHALRDIFAASPAEMDAHVRNVVGAFVRRHGFAGFESYVTKRGRARFIEVNILVPPELHAAGIPQFDSMRDQLAAELGGDNQPHWLTICFTADRRYM